MEVNKNQKNAVGVKPTLLSSPEIGISANNDTINHATDERILSSLQVEPPSGKQANKKARGTSTRLLSWLGISVITTVAGFSGYQYLSGVGADVLQTVVIASNTTTMALPPVVSAQQVVVATAPASSTETAQIVTDTSAAPTPIPNEAKLTTALEEGVKPPPSAIQKALETQMPGKTEAKAKQPKPVAETDPAPVPKKKQKVNAKLAPESSLADPARTQTAPVQSGPDEDITLLAALITHEDASAAPDRTAGAKTSAVSDVEKKKKEKKAQKIKAAKEKDAFEKKKKLLAETADN